MTSQTHQLWAEIDQYFDNLELAIDRLENCLTEIRACTASGQFEPMHGLVESTANAVKELEVQLDLRNKLLLRFASEQKRPRSLRAYLKDSNEVDRLIRADQLASRIDDQRRATIAIFTAHFWIQDTTSEIVRLLTNPGPHAGTYGTKTIKQGGGLLDKAA